jgi:aminoglycoside phosphotransferase (APT) family kinase protein
MFKDLGDLRADRLGSALVGAGAATGRVVDARVEAIDDAAGFLGTLRRVHLTWEGGTGPATVIAKLPTSIPGNQEIVDHFGYDRREAGVYRDLRPWERACAPRALAQEWDDAIGRGWLLLEDLHDHEGGDGVAGATDTQALSTVTALAEWHAAFWNDPRLAELPWLPDSTDPVVAGYGRIFDLTWDTCMARLDGVPDHIAAAAHEGRAWFDQAIREFADGDRTLVHGDARLDNVRFENVRFENVRAGRAGAVLLDFQLAAHGRGMYDVAFFCAGSLRTEDRRRLEPELIERYRATLAGAGITVPAETLWRDYRLGHMMNLPNPVSALAVVTPNDERGAEFLRLNAQRGLAAVADHVGLLG